MGDAKESSPNYTALPVHVTKQNGGQQIKFKKIPAAEWERVITALTFAIQDKFNANAIM